MSLPLTSTGASREFVSPLVWLVYFAFEGKTDWKSVGNVEQVMVEWMTLWPLFLVKIPARDFRCFFIPRAWARFIRGYQKFHPKVSDFFKISHTKDNITWIWYQRLGDRYAMRLYHHILAITTIFFLSDFQLQTLPELLSLLALCFSIAIWLLWIARRGPIAGIGACYDRRNFNRFVLTIHPPYYVSNSAQ